MGAGHYCDVSDAWRILNKWRRTAIGAAGIYVALLIASAALFIWWFTEPGFLHHVCLFIMMMASVSTLVLNGHPLMRYDGYLVLSDLLEVLNLAERAWRGDTGSTLPATSGATRPTKSDES